MSQSTGFAIDIRGYCPACGAAKLQAMSHVGIVHCTNPECPRLQAIHEILSTPVIDHLLVTHDRSWTLVHPLIERLDNAMLGCTVGDKVSFMMQTQSGPAEDDAVYRVTVNDLGDLCFQGLP
jgi:hypothetical protein